LVSNTRGSYGILKFEGIVSFPSDSGGFTFYQKAMLSYEKTNLSWIDKGRIFEPSGPI